MIEQIDTGADNVIGFRLYGRVGRTDVEDVARQVEDALTRHPKLRVYVEVEPLEGISARALIDDLGFSLRHLRHFEREAIVSDERWLEAIARASDRLFPSIKVRHFRWAEREQALDWIRR